MTLTTTQTAEADRLVGLVRAQFGLTDLVVHIGRLLADTGRPATLDELAAAGGWTREQLTAELDRHPGVDYDDGRIVGFGLTLRPTPHRFTIDGGRTVYAFCATDTFEFPAILGRAGTVESVCAATGQPVRVRLGLDRVITVDPPTAVVSKIRPDHPVADVRAEICNLGNFFASPEAATNWHNANPHGLLASVADDYAITRLAMIKLGWHLKHSDDQ